MAEEEGSRTWLVLLGVAAALVVIAVGGSVLGGDTQAYVGITTALVAAGVGAYLGRRIGTNL